jgi:dTDP-4-amino-4,6-dideoxygalactose transaminase
MICFKDQHLDKEVRKWTWLGIDKDTYSRTHGEGAYKWMYEVEYVGFKYHGNSIMAAMGLVSLKYLDQDNAYRRQIASWYDGLLAQDRGIATVATPPGCESSQHLYQVMVENRDNVMLALNAHQIFPGVHYRNNADYRMYENFRRDCPRCEEASAKLISLPIHLRLSYSDVVRVSRTLRHAASL